MGLGVLAALTGLARGLCRVFGCQREKRLPSSQAAQDYPPTACDGTLYGPLLDAPGLEGAQSTPDGWYMAEGQQVQGVGEGVASARRRVQRRIDVWVCRAAWAEALYAALFLAVALAFALHVTAHRFTWLVELVLLVFMLISKAVVAFAAFLIHRHLSPAARSIAGLWLVVYAVGTFSTACFALSFLSPLGFLLSNPRSWCSAAQLASVPALGVLLLQVVSSLALLVLQNRIRGPTPQSDKHLLLAGWWRNTLVRLSAAICVLWYLGSAAVILAVWGVAPAAPAAGVIFVLCAQAQMCVGLSFHKINSALKMHFAGGFCKELKTRGGGEESAEAGGGGGSGSGGGDNELQPTRAGYLPPAATADSDACDLRNEDAGGSAEERVTVAGGRGGVGVGGCWVSRSAHAQDALAPGVVTVHLSS